MVPSGNATSLTPVRPVRVPRTPTSSTFTELSRQVHAAGLTRRRYGCYSTELVAAVVLVAAWTVGFVHLGESWWQLENAVVLAVLVTQVGFLVHDAAHRQIFRSGRWNDRASLLVADLPVGTGHGWWQDKHSRHHADPDKDDVDPDTAIAALPSMARPHLRRAAPIVAAHCATHGVPGTQTGLRQSYRPVVGHLDEIGLRGADPFPARWSPSAAPTGPAASVRRTRPGS